MSIPKPPAPPPTRIIRDPIGVPGYCLAALVGIIGGLVITIVVRLFA